MKILFVCMGNICRSPTAEGVMRKLVAEQGREDEFVIDSAGTGAWHVGNPPDSRATAAAAARNIPLESRARQVTVDDFDEYDLIIAMDSDNQEDLVRLTGGDDSKVRLLRDYADGGGKGVPDPYYGGDDGFEEVLDIVVRNSAALLEEIDRQG